MGISTGRKSRLLTDKEIGNYLTKMPLAPFFRHCKRKGCKAMTNASGYCPSHLKQIELASEPYDIVLARRRGRESLKKKGMRY